MCLDAESFADGENLEEERELALVLFADLGGHERFVFLDELEEGALGFVVLGREGRVCTHP